MVEILWWAFIVFVLVQVVLIGVRRFRQQTRTLHEARMAVQDAMGAKQAALRAERDAESDRLEAEQLAGKEVRTAGYEDQR